MSETKYLSVIHSPTGEVVSAFKFETDATWVGKEKDGLIATADYCKPDKIVKMIFVKTYKKSNGKTVYAYFRSAPNQTGLLNNLSGESEDHKQSKHNIYTDILSENITINGEVIDKRLIENISLEYRHSLTGHIIPDVLIKFKEIHPKYGLGIFIEIQLSNQSQEETIIRTYQRVIEGFSGAWIYKKDFDDKNNLLDKNLIIKSHRQLLSELDERLENNFIKRINNYGQVIDKKIENGKKDLWNSLKTSIDLFKEEIKDIEYNKKIELISIRDEINKLYELKKDINLNYIKQDLEEIKLKYIKNFTDDIVKEYNDAIKITKEVSNSEIKRIVDNNVSKLKKFCPKCDKPMKIGKAMSGYNWYCSDFPIKCDGLIKDVSFENEG